MKTNYNKGVETHHSAYNAPGEGPGAGTPSSIGNEQFNTKFWWKKALVEAAKTQYFGQMSSTKGMPKHMGKRMVRYHYLPLLDDANINDQGIDAAGNYADSTVVAPFKATIAAWPEGIGFPAGVTAPAGIMANPAGVIASAEYPDKLWFVGEGATAADADTAATAAADAYFAALGVRTGIAAITDLATAEANGWQATGITAGVAALPTVSSNTGNLYGSSKDVGYIVGKLPALSEHGGRVNRVGYKRVEIEGSLEKFGFFDEYTQESVDFDTDAELMMHRNSEMMKGANEMTEDALQIDLLHSAGMVRYGGAATSMATISGDDDGLTPSVVAPSLITYEDLMRLNIDLDNNRTPKDTKIITGSRMIDTRVINGARYLYIGSEMIPSIKKMKDLFDQQAFISVEKYASAGTIARGEIGVVDQFRIIVVPEMMHFAASGAAPSTGAGTTDTGVYRRSADASGADKYDVFPMLVIGSEAFVTIGFQTDGKNVKFKIYHKKPGEATANRDDPYGEIGFSSIKWYYGFMLLRPEHIALCLSVAEY